MELLDALKQHFGYDAFRKGQEAIVRSVLSGRPTIAILPTGGGKSLCYQLPALLLEGTTVVVSPLVALMKDQVDALRARGIAATFVNSSLPESERQDRQGALRRGEYRLVYVAPERFKSPSFLSAMADLTVPLLAVDEAHCISAWGHDFRPEYQQLARAREQVRAERVLALTATATPEVRRDIADALELRDPRVFVAGFDWPNLFIEVLRVSGDKDKLGRLVALSRSGGPGIVYAATRKNVEKVVGVLRASEIDAVGYHAGMADAEDGGAGTLRAWGGARHRRHQRVRNGRRQGGHPVRRPFRRSPLPRGVLPGDRTRRPRRPGQPRSAPLQLRRRDDAAPDDRGGPAIPRPGGARLGGRARVAQGIRRGGREILRLQRARAFRRGPVARERRPSGARARSRWSILRGYALGLRRRSRGRFRAARAEGRPRAPDARSAGPVRRHARLP